MMRSRRYAFGFCERQMDRAAALFTYIFMILHCAPVNVALSGWADVGFGRKTATAAEVSRRQNLSESEKPRFFFAKTSEGVHDFEHVFKSTLAAAMYGEGNASEFPRIDTLQRIRLLSISDRYNADIQIRQ